MSERRFNSLSKADVDAAIANMDREEALAGAADASLHYEVLDDFNVVVRSLPASHLIFEGEHHPAYGTAWLQAEQKRRNAPWSSGIARDQILRFVRSWAEDKKEPGPWDALVARYGRDIAAWSEVSPSETESERIALDVEYVMKRLERLFTVRQAKIWMESQNSNLGGRPIDVIAFKGVERVIEAVNVVEQNAY